MKITYDTVQSIDLYIYSTLVYMYVIFEVSNTNVKDLLT